MADYIYGNNADINETDEQARPAWTDQPVTVPLQAWTDLLVRVERLTHERDEFRNKWYATFRTDKGE